jgi:hypothetical protein
VAAKNKQISNNPLHEHASLAIRPRTWILESLLEGSEELGAAEGALGEIFAGAVVAAAGLVTLLWAAYLKKSAISKRAHWQETSNHNK